MKHKGEHKQNSTLQDGEKQLLLEQIRSAYNQFEDKLNQLSILRELGTALLYINDFKRVCQTIMKILIKNTMARNCSIMLMDHDSNRLFLIAAIDPYFDTSKPAASNALRR